MAKKHDDLAAALNAMADGHHADDESTESHHGDEAGHAPAAAPPPAQPVRPAKAARPAATTPPPAAARPTRPTAPAAAPVAKVAPPQPTAAPAPAEAKPAARVRPTAPSNRPTAPSAPVPPSPVDAGGDNPFDHAPPDDDDAVIVPAPDQSVFAARPKPAPVVRKARVPVYQTLHFRQTVIPIMLTSGTLAIVLALIRFALTDDSIFAAVPAAVAIILLVLGLLLLAAAGLNIVQVKQMLEAEKPAS